MSKPRTRPFIRALLIDVSGTLHVGATPTPNAMEAFRRLRASNIPFRLCSNTSKESTASLVNRLNKLGLDIQYSANLTPSTSPGVLGKGDDISQQHQPRARKEVWTSIGALAQYLRDQDLEWPYFLLSPSAKEEVLSAGFQGGQQDNCGELLYDSVVVGFAPDLFDYLHLNTAFRILKGEQDVTLATNSDQLRGNVSHVHTKPSRVKLIATHKAKYIQTEVPVGLSLGPGPFVTALEMATGVQVQIVGKPTELFFQTVINDFHATGELIKSDNTGIAVIGDDVEADLGDGAVEMGLWRVLVKTGKYRTGDENRPDITAPDEVFDSFSAFVESLLSTQQAKL